MAECLSQSISQDAGNDIRAASSRKANDDLDGPVRPSLGLSASCWHDAHHQGSDGERSNKWVPRGHGPAPSLNESRNSRSVAGVLVAALWRGRYEQISNLASPI